MRTAFQANPFKTVINMFTKYWSLSDYDLADRESTRRIIKKQSRGSISAQNGWYMSEADLEKQSKEADKHMENLKKAIEKAPAKKPIKPELTP